VRRLRHLAGEVARFLAVGGVATLVSLVGFNVLAHGVVAYVGMMTYAFRDRGVGDPLAGLVRFFGLGAATMVIPVGCLWVSRYMLGLSSPLADNLSANVVGLVLGAAARFWVFRRYVFDHVVGVEG
jgi:putative flippase GtrA